MNTNQSISIRINVLKSIKSLLTIIYSLALIYLVFFARRRRHMEERYLNLIPFKNSIQSFLSLDSNSKQQLYDFYSNLIGNIFLFIPLPFILFFIIKHAANRQILLIAIGFSIFIELIQYVFMIGVADIDDVILNSLGALIGIYLMNSVRKYRQAVAQE